MTGSHILMLHLALNSNNLLHLFDYNHFRDRMRPSKGGGGGSCAAMSHVYGNRCRLANSCKCSCRFSRYCVAGAMCRCRISMP